MIVPRMLKMLVCRKRFERDSAPRYNKMIVAIISHIPP